MENIVIKWKNSAAANAMTPVTVSAPEFGGPRNVDAATMVCVAKSDADFLCAQLIVPFVEKHSGRLSGDMCELMGKSVIEEVFKAIRRFQAAGVPAHLTDIYHRTAKAAIDRSVAGVFAPFLEKEKSGAT